MTRRASIAAVLGQIIRVKPPRRVRRTSATPVVIAPLAASAICVHLFERRHCRHCGLPAPGARQLRGSRTPVGRGCAPEKDVQRAVIHLLCAIGCRYDPSGLDSDIYVLGTKRPRNLPSQAHRTFQTPGIPDLFAFLPALRRYERPTLPPAAVWIEVKAEDGHASPAQLSFADRAQFRGVPYVRGGFDQVRAFLVDHGFLVRATS